MDTLASLMIWTAYHDKNILLMNFYNANKPMFDPIYYKIICYDDSFLNIKAGLDYRIHHPPQSNVAYLYGIGLIY